MTTIATIFWALAGGAGALVLFAGVLWAGGWGVVKVLEYLRVWSTLKLCVAVQLHGDEYLDHLFWEAVSERVSRSDFAADTVIQFVQRKRPSGAEAAADE
jgi:hypothetical protein